MSSSSLSPAHREMLDSLVGLLEKPEHLVLSALEKNNWNPDSAADDLLTGAPLVTVTAAAPRDIEQGVLNAPPSSPKGVIDLTSTPDDDANLAQALQASLSDAPGASLPPSYYSDEYKKKNWALAPRTDVPMISAEDQELNRALEASLSSSLIESSTDVYEEPPVQDRIRLPGHPLALRARAWTAAYLCHLFQALYHIPQVRNTIREMRFTDVAAELPHADSMEIMQNMFVQMEQSKESFINLDNVFDQANDSGGTQGPGPHTACILGLMAEGFDSYALISGWNERKSLLRSSFGDINQPDETTQVAWIRVAHQQDSLDLVTALAQELNNPHPWKCFFSFPEVLVFHIEHKEGGFPPATEKKPFRYPASFYPDRFAFDNAYEATNRIAKGKTHSEAVDGLHIRRKALTELNGRDTLKDMRATLHYFAEVASDDGTPERRAQLETAKVKLAKVLARVENELDSIDAQVIGLQQAASTLFDTPDLQKHLYNLRAVLFHDGLYTRTHVWSYVKADDGQWWKIQDLHTTQVTEDVVLNDTSGLHMGAGPYMLFYSRADGEVAPPETASWPEAALRKIEGYTRDFEERVANALAGRVVGRGTIDDPMDLD
ncbi:hypothetical protein AURDEDRAFT_181578 [Auricularia subglabra TFB-10046 SS5]|nr:hypothetical protein AURDEDRAFT_181578 [Auricularia subglabra TFB-10046 SS5]